MRHATRRWVRLGILGLMLWPVVVMAYGDWRVGQAQELPKQPELTPVPSMGCLAQGRRRGFAAIKLATDYRRLACWMRPPGMHSSLHPAGVVWSKRPEEANRSRG
jgi:hypothetical protein